MKFLLNVADGLKFFQRKEHWLIRPHSRRLSAHNLPQWTPDPDVSGFELTISIDTVKSGVDIEKLSMDAFAKTLSAYEM